MNRQLAFPPSYIIPLKFTPFSAFLPFSLPSPSGRNSFHFFIVEIHTHPPIHPSSFLSFPLFLLILNSSFPHKCCRLSPSSHSHFKNLPFCGAITSQPAPCKRHQPNREGRKLAGAMETSFGHPLQLLIPSQSVCQQRMAWPQPNNSSSSVAGGEGIQTICVPPPRPMNEGRKGPN